MAGDLSEYDPTLDDPGWCPRMPFTSFCCAHSPLWHSPVPIVTLILQKWHFQYSSILSIIKIHQNITFNHYFCQSCNPQIALIQTSDSTRHAPLRHSCLDEATLMDALNHCRTGDRLTDHSSFISISLGDMKIWRHEMQTNETQHSYKACTKSWTFFPNDLGICSR